MRRLARTLGAGRVLPKPDVSTRDFLARIRAAAPELLVPCAPFFERLKLRKMEVKVTRKSGWGLAT